MRRLLVHVLAVLVVLVALVSSAGAASAAKVVIDDGSGDIWSAVYDDATEAYVYEQAGEVANTDVVRTTLQHTAKALKLTVVYADLVEGDGIHEPTYRAWFRLSDGRNAMLSIWSNDAEGTSTFLWRAKAEVGRRASCSGLKAAFDWDSDTLSATLPRSCVGNPEWVRFHGVGSSWDGDDQPGPSYVDNAGDSSHDPAELLVHIDCFSRCVGWTGKIKRG